MNDPGRTTDGHLVAEQLEVAYGDRRALGPIDLALPPASLVAVTGSSSSGKSTLLAALAGAARPSGGSVRLGREQIDGRGAAARLGVSLMPEGGTLVSTLTAAENVLVPLLAARVPPPEARERAETALDAVGLAEEVGHLPEELSGGQQQRVAVAVLLASRGRVLLADEPTSELDAGNRQRVLAALRAQADAGAIVVVATHDPEAAAPADAELVLDEGVGTWARTLPGAAVLA